MASIVIYGIRSSKNNKNSKDYFVANKQMSWIPAMLSIVATETSVLTFISIPGLAYNKGNFFFLQLVLGYVIGRVLVSYILLPSYFNNEISSIYEIIGKKFGRAVHKLTSLVFLITRVFADGIRFFATASIIHVITGWNFKLSLIIIGFTTLVYSIYGGIKTIIKIDALQFWIYLSGGIFTIIYIVSQLANPIQEINSIIFDSQYINLNSNIFYSTDYFIVDAIIGGALFAFASHGVDYMMVQRVLSTKNLNSAKKAMIGSGFFVFIQFSLFLIVGFLMKSHVGNSLSNYPNNELFAHYINTMPIYLKSFLVIGVLSATMSTLSSSINSLASSTLIDWFGKKSISLKHSMLASLFWAIILMIITPVFENESSILVEVGLKIASFTYGPLLGLFLLTKFKKDFKSYNIFYACIMSLLMIFVVFSFGISWTWWVAVGAISLMLYSHLFCYIDKLLSQS